MKAVNLLPSDQRATQSASAPVAARREGAPDAGPYLVLGALALCVLALAGYVLAGNTVKQHEADLAAASAREQAVTAEAARLQPYADFDALASSRVATVRDLAGQRFDWEQGLRDLSRAIPADVTLTSLDGTVSSEGGNVGGGGGGGLRGAINAPAIEIAGCTRNQRQVAGLMARLRNIDGVTRVSLAKSEKSDAAAVSPAAPAGIATPGQAEGCGAGNPPEFEMVMFFEGDADVSAAAASSSAPASAPAGGAAPAATPAAGTDPAASATPAAGSSTTTPASTQGGVTP